MFALSLIVWGSNVQCGNYHIGKSEKSGAVC